MSYPILIIILVVLVLVSAFFSSSETGMMSLNRYRLRHMARSKHKIATRVAHLLLRPDRLLGVILIGNTFSNVLASAVATMIAVQYLGGAGIIVVTIVLTLILLIFAETAPKTFAALYPQKVAFMASLPLKWLLIIFYPIVFVVNIMANGLLSMFGVKVKQSGVDALSREELRSVVLDASTKISRNYQQMLLRILDLSAVSVEDVLVPRNEVYGIDINTDIKLIHQQLLACHHSHVPLYNESYDHLEGMLLVRKALTQLAQGTLTHAKLLALADKIYYVPEGVTLNQLLLNFQSQHLTVGLVVDEYGEVQGLVSLQDVLEEIVGEFSKIGVADVSEIVHKQKDGGMVINGVINIRDLNRMTHWHLPEEGPKTLSGLIVAYLGVIPRAGIAVRISGYPMEILAVEDNIITRVCVWPDLYE